MGVRANSQQACRLATNDWPRFLTSNGGKMRKSARWTTPLPVACCVSCIGLCHLEQKGRHWDLNFLRLQGDALLHFPHFRGVREARYLLPRPLLRALAGRAPARACCPRVYCLHGVERITRSHSRKYDWCPFYGAYSPQDVAEWLRNV